MADKKLDLLWTPLHEAARNGDVKGVELFLATISPNAKDSTGQTPLHWPSAHGRLEVVKLLLKAGADPNIKEHLGYTPLHVAAAYGHVEVVQCLLVAGADALAKTKSGQTPKMLALGQEDVKSILVVAEDCQEHEDQADAIRSACIPPPELRAKGGAYDLRTKGGAFELLRKILDQRKASIKEGAFEKGKQRGMKCPACGIDAEADMRAAGKMLADGVLPKPTPKPAPFFDMHCYGLKLREGKAQGGMPSIWDYIPGDKIPFMELSPRPRTAMASLAAEALGPTCQFKEGDAILGPDGSLAVMVERGRGKERAKNWFLAGIQNPRWWKLKDANFDMVELWPPSAELNEWVEMYYRTEKGDAK